jgi:ketosteroid isomerase-like protein
MDIAREKSQLLRRDAEWAAVASEGRDVECILSYWTDDAVVLPPDMRTIIDKAALRQYVESSLQIPGFRITWSSTDVALSPDAQLAYLVSGNAITTDAMDGRPVTTYGRAITIWRRDSEGQWRCAVDIWNAEPAAQHSAA